MGKQANLSRVIVSTPDGGSGVSLSPSAEWTLGWGGEVREVMKNLDGTLSTQVTPEPDVCSGTVRLSQGSVLEEMFQKEDLTVTCYLRNGDVYQCTNAIIQNHPDLATDGGEVELEFAGNGEFL